MLIGHIIDVIEQFAPPALQESYDNCGLIIGNRQDECSGVLLTVDVTEAVVEEAVSVGCNLIVAHHPLIFKGIRKINGSTPQQRAIIGAVRSGIAVYACHTSLDSTPGGVSQRMASMLGLTDVKPLEQPADKLLKLQVFVPGSHADDLRLALFDAGAGAIGNYDSCSYNVEGRGTFRARPGADPYIGEIGEMHTEQEVAVQVVLPSWRRHAVEQALLQVHPYEEPAYEFIALMNAPSMTGLGAVGNLPRPMSPAELAELIKKTFGSSVVRSNIYPADAVIRRLALCGGSGGSLIPAALGAHAQAMLTSDIRYHDFVDYADTICLMDIGHHESENCSKSIFYDIISEKFPNFAVRYSQADINPITYL